MTALESAYAALCDLLQLAAAGACGRKITAVPKEWKLIFRLAHEHQVVPLLGCALLDSFELQCPEEYREYALNVMRSVSSANLLRKQRLFYLLCELREAGINACILKGYYVYIFYYFGVCCFWFFVVLFFYIYVV